MTGTTDNVQRRMSVTPATVPSMSPSDSKATPPGKGRQYVLLPKDPKEAFAAIQQMAAEAAAQESNADVPAADDEASNDE